MTPNNDMPPNNDMTPNYDLTPHYDIPPNYEMTFCYDISSVQDAKQCRRRFFYSVKKKDSKCLAECFLMLLLQVKIRSHLKLTKLSKFSLALNPKKI